MQTRSYRFINRKMYWPHDWPEGPWDDEPDKIQYTDAASGLPCLIIRNPSMGSLCGYVGVPPDHPWHGQDIWEMKDPPEAHGGVNYSAFCADEMPEEMGICHVPGSDDPPHVWWFGYACDHLVTMDRCPAMEALLVSLGGAPMPRGDLFYPSYKRVEFVMDQNAMLAEQIMAAAPKALTA